MPDTPYDGPERVPEDTEIVQFLRDRIAKNNEFLYEKMTELKDTLDDCDKKGEPKEFAYGKMCRWAEAQDSPTLIYLCAAAMWTLNDLERFWEDMEKETNGT